jgi:class 3 adenylate cyclase
MLVTDTPAGRVSRADLMRETKSDPAMIERLVQIGVLHPDEDGMFSHGDIQRVFVAAAYVAGGIGLELLEEHIRGRRMTFAYVDRIYPEPSTRSGRTVADLEAQLDAPGVVGDLCLALGLVRPDAEHELTVVEEALLRDFVASWRASRDWPESMYRAARLVGDATRRIVEGWVGIFSSTIALTPDRSSGMTVDEIAPVVMEPGARLAELIRPMTEWLIDRNMERALNALNIDTMERALEAQGLRPATPEIPPAIVFADFSGFTRMTEERGDETAARQAAALSTLAAHVAADGGGRLVKELGDGVLLRFPDAPSGARAALAIRDATARSQLPAVHVGLSAGTLVERDGDYYGRTVNLAARLSSAAASGEILVDDVTAALLPPSQVTPLGSRELKGIPRPVSVYRLTVDTPGVRP